jgi:hypothetical protein
MIHALHVAAITNVVCAVAIIIFVLGSGGRWIYRMLTKRRAYRSVK